jgi:hypothetical protein
MPAHRLAIVLLCFPSVDAGGELVDAEEFDL